MSGKVQSTLKSADTEEWLDVVWTRPIGYAWARLFERMGTHPNTVTVLSMIIGAASALFLVRGSFRTEGSEGLIANVAGVLLLAWANFYDSADGQLARMTGKKTRLGRILDGAAGDIWFIAIYLALIFRFYHHHAWEYAALGIADTPHTAIMGTLAYFALCALSSLVCHARQCALADYYRQAHLHFLSGEAGGELTTSRRQRDLFRSMPWRGNVIEKLFLLTYIGYTQGQERQTPRFQALMAELLSRYGSVDRFPTPLREEFRAKSRPLMKWANILTFNTRAIVLYLSCLADMPWIYLLFETLVLTGIHLYMRHIHEAFCRTLHRQLHAGNS